MTHKTMRTCCATCLAFMDGCCLLSDLPTVEEDVCTDYRPKEDERFKTRKSHGR